MGQFTQRIEVGRLDEARFEPVDLMVDTGSTYTWLPQALVTRLGLKPSGHVQVRLADGRVIEKNGLTVLVRINGEARGSFCLVAEQDDALLLGALTLETFSLGVDPVNKRLMPVVASAMPARRSPGGLTGTPGF